MYGYRGKLNDLKRGKRIEKCTRIAKIVLILVIIYG